MKCATSPAAPGCRWPRSATAPASASSASGHSASSSRSTCRTSPAPSSPPTVPRWASTSACPSTHWGSAAASASAASVAAAASPGYVVGKQLADNTLLVAQGEEHPALYSHRLATSEVNWLCAMPPQLDGITVRLRYRQDDQPARVMLAGSGVAIEPLDPQRAVTPGQSAVLYRATRCLGGGVIVQTGLNPALFWRVQHDRQFPGPNVPQRRRQAAHHLELCEPAAGKSGPPALFAEDPAGEPAALRGWRQRYPQRHRGHPRLGRQGCTQLRNLLHARARDHAGLHRRALRGGPRRHARGHLAPRRQPREGQSAGAG